MPESIGGLSIIIPCHNEERAIVRTLDDAERAGAATGIPFEIIVVDDGSTDRSAEQIDEKRFRLVRMGDNRGYGAALKTGARLARYDAIAIADADGAYPIERIPDLVALLAEADMAVGARRADDPNIPGMRKPAKRVLNLLANWLTGKRIPDLNSGLRAVRRPLWMQFEHYYPDGFSLTTTITLAALTNGFRVVYVPIEYHPRVGYSKIRPIRDTLNFITLILRTVLYFDPLKIFIPLSFSLIAASLLVGVGSKLLTGELMDVSTTVLFVTGLQLLMTGMLADLIVKRMK